MIDFPADRSDRRGRRGVFAALFLGALAAGPVLQVLSPLSEKEAQKELPKWRADSVLAGHYARGLERYLEERSPITAWFRSRFVELELMAGAFEHSLWVIRPGGWTFLAEHVDHASAQMDRAGVERRAFIRALGARVRRIGLRVVAVIAPDKAHIYPDRIFVDEDAPAEARSQRYAAVLDEFRDVGFATVDAASILLARRRSHPSERLYWRRDAHWAFDGASLVAREIADLLLRDPERLGSVAPVEVTPLVDPLTDPYIFSMIGVEPGAASTRWIPERQRLVSPWFGDAVANGQFDADIALVGDSFAEGEVEPVLPILLSRPIDADGAIAAGGPCRGILETLERIESGDCAAKTLVWVFVERHAFRADLWTEFSANGAAGEGR